MARFAPVRAPCLSITSSAMPLQKTLRYILAGEGRTLDDTWFVVWYTVYWPCETACGPRFWSFNAMVYIQQTLRTQHQSQQERADQQARKQRVVASLRRLQQRYSAVCLLSLRLV